MAEREAEERRTGMRLRGRKPSPPEPAKERQANVTDPDSKIMKTQHCRFEWIFENTAHNVLKLWRAGRRSGRTPTRKAKRSQRGPNSRHFAALCRCPPRSGTGFSPGQRL